MRVELFDFDLPEERIALHPAEPRDSARMLVVHPGQPLEDRQKHVWVKDQHPDLDIRFVFSNAKAKLRKGSPTTYADWASNNGFLWAHKTVPNEWLTEKGKAASKKAIEALRR